MGQDIGPEIYRLKNGIENYNPNEPQISKDFIMVESDETRLLEDKYADCQPIGGSDNENQK